MQLRKYSEHIILSFVLISITQLVYALYSGVFSGQLADPDCYTWLARATQLNDARQWLDSTLYRVDPPYGLEQHYTRPLEVLLMAGAWVIMPFAGFEKALYAWGALLSPILHVAAVLFLVWAFSSVYNNRQLVFLALGFIVQPAIFAAFLAGRPDHHSLSILFFIVSLGLLVRLMHNPVRKLWAWSAGFISALAFWVNVANGVFIVLPILVFLNVLWFLKEKNIGTAFFHYSASLLVFSVAALLMQNGWGEFNRPEVDRISIVFILFFFLVTLYAFFVQRYDFWGKIQYRLLFSGAAGIGLIGVMYAVFPQLFAGIEIDPLYREVRTANIVHHTPILSLEWPEGIIHFIFWIGIILPTSIWFVNSLLTKKWWQGLISNPRKSIYVKLSIFSIIMIVFYAQNALTVRYIHYVEMICLLGYVVLMDNTIKRIEFRFDMSKTLYIVRPLAMFVLLTWVYYPMAFLNKSDSSNGFDADILSAVKYVSNMDQVEKRPMNIMAAPEMGPYLLYHTENNVFSITNHRVRQGFFDWYHIMAAESDDLALSIINDRNVDMILISRPLDGSYFKDLEKDAFVHRLLADEKVQWLERVETPEGVPKDILIYMVVHQEGFYEAHHPDTLF